jgi:hypothetical protein
MRDHYEVFMDDLAARRLVASGGLRKKGVDIAKKDFRSLKDKYKLDHLVAIDITAWGS